MSSVDLNSAFATYFDDMKRCQSANAYWSLLHVLVCLPDICAAMQSEDGKTDRSRYENWCGKFFSEPLLNPAERYRMRCKVLHQGRASTEQPGRYSGFAFGQPVGPESDHLRLDGSVLHLDVARLAIEYRQAVENWIRAIESSPSSPEAVAVVKNLPLLVKVSRIQVQVAPSTSGGGFGFVQVNKTS